MIEDTNLIHLAQKKAASNPEELVHINLAVALYHQLCFNSEHGSTADLLRATFLEQDLRNYVRGIMDWSVVGGS